MRELCVFERRARRLEPIGRERGGRDDAQRASAMTPTGCVAGRRLVLGGVEIPHELGLDGHSDADVLAHAVIDALLGAAGLGDIGEHFPDTDERWRDADSIELLRDASSAMLGAQGLRDRQRRLHGRAWRRPKLGAAPRRRSASAWRAALGLAAAAREREGDAPARGSASSAAARASRRSPWRACERERLS